MARRHRGRGADTTVLWVAAFIIGGVWYGNSGTPTPPPAPPQDQYQLGVDMLIKASAHCPEGTRGNLTKNTCEATAYRALCAQTGHSLVCEQAHNKEQRVANSRSIVCGPPKVGNRKPDPAC